MELYQLRMFVAVAELGNLTHAADRLHLSQPAASAQIKLLEEEFGVTLFERKQSGLALTQAGASLLPRVQHLLETAGEIVVHAKSFSGRITGPIKLAIIVTLFDNSLLRLDQMMNLILARQPHLDIELHHRNSRSIIAGVTNGEFDAGICMGDRKIPKIHRVILRKMPHRIVAPPSLGGRMRKASWRELAAANWVSVPKGGSHDQMMSQLYKRLRRRPNKSIEGDSEQILTSLVMAGVGLGLMREDLAVEMEKAGNIIVVDKGRPLTYLQYIYRTGRENDPAIRAVSDVLSELWPDTDRPSQKRPTNSIKTA
jgi:DNA-binding transcriptional LysR family regulator